VVVQLPILYEMFKYIVPIEGDFLMHPTAFAAWVGFLVTALNLLPMGQLDGGHIARALLGGKAKYLGYATIAVLAGVSVTLYFGWIILVFLVLFLGVRHPPPLNDLTPLDAKRKGLGVLTFVLLVLAFAPVPMTPILADYSFELEPQGNTNLTIEQGGTVYASVTIENGGNSVNAIEVYGEDSPIGWTLSFRLAGSLNTSFSPDVTVLLNSSESASVDVMITSPVDSQLGEHYNLTLGGLTLNSTEKRTLVYDAVVRSSMFSYDITAGFEPVMPGAWTMCTVLVHNNGTSNATVTIAPTNDHITFIEVFILVDGQNSSEYATLAVPGKGSAYFSVNVYAGPYAEPGDAAISVGIFYNDILHRMLELPFTVI